MEYKVIIVGATSLIAEKCANIWLENNIIELILIARNPAKLSRIAQNLRIRFPKIKINEIISDFVNPDNIQKTVDSITIKNCKLNILIAQGALPNQNSCQENIKLCDETLKINGISPILFSESLVSYMLKNNCHGTLTIIGSVAGDRGRKSNYIYGAAKSMLVTYVQGLQHRLANTNIKILLIKPGPTDTPMTAHLKSTGLNLAPVDLISKKIIRKIIKEKPISYIPEKWRFIMYIIRNIPRIVFNKIDI